MKVVWSKRAGTDLDEIAQYIAQDKPLAAANWVAELLSSTRRLADFPYSGQQVPEKADPQYREIIVGTYRVIYRVTTQVEVLLVRRATRLLRQEELET